MLVLPRAAEPLFGRFSIAFTRKTFDRFVILAARATVRMGSDHPHFAPLLFDCQRRAEMRVMTTAAGYDWEENHRVGWTGRASLPTRHEELFAAATYGQRWPFNSPQFDFRTFRAHWLIGRSDAMRAF